MKFHNILFDLDGTLTDSGPGIMTSGRYALEHLGIPCPEEQVLRTMVGPPLTTSFARFGVPENRIEEAILLYREKYNNQGAKYENEVYPGMEEALQALRDAGCKLYVATSKPEPLARDILEHFGLDVYFEYIAGATMDRSRETKADVLRYLLERIECAESTLMVGDTSFDVLGALELGLPCLGVAWGYGDVQEMREAGAVEIVRDVKEMLAYINAMCDKQGYEELGSFAKVDTDRKARQGFAEVVYCAGKRDEYLVDIYKKLYERDGEVFGTRATEAQYQLVKEVIPEITYDPVSRILKAERPGKMQIGCVAVCTAGTADIPVAEEAAQTAEYFGTRVQRIYDVGVSGIHRLLAHEKELQEANCVIAVAGMEGALASVIGGLVPNPVIAVPTSVGYGASFEGLSALLTMINSCANGIATVNIDNGYGAGYLATQINRLAVNVESHPT